MIDQIVDLVKNKDTNLYYTHEIYPVLSHCIQGAKNQQTKVLGHKSKIKQKKAWL